MTLVGMLYTSRAPHKATPKRDFNQKYRSDCIGKSTLPARLDRAFPN